LSNLKVDIRWAKNDPGGWISPKKGQAFDKKTESKKSVR